MSSVPHFGRSVVELKELHECRNVERFLCAEFIIPAVMWRDIVKVRQRRCKSLLLDTCPASKYVKSVYGPYAK